MSQKSIGEKIIGELKSRSGFDGWWDDIDEEFQIEIINDLNELSIQYVLDTFEKIARAWKDSYQKIDEKDQ